MWKYKTKVKYTIIGPITHDEQFYTCYEHKHIFEISCIFLKDVALMEIMEGANLYM
jgi:hypothetical protein